VKGVSGFHQHRDELIARNEFFEDLQLLAGKVARLACLAGDVGAGPVQGLDQARATGSPAKAAKAATSTIPIVFTSVDSRTSCSGLGGSPVH
jgi:hypothetical protein